MRCLVGVVTHRKSRRASTGGFPGHGSGVAAKPGDRMSEIVKLRIRRGGAGEPQYEEAYDVPFEPGQSVLDALRWIRSHRDPTLAIRYSCTSANTCKECMVRVDGKT